MKLLTKNVLLAGILLTGAISCKKILDVKPGTELTAGQMYRDVYDANAAVMGIYGKFMSLSDRYIILNELRGDLLEYTQNADEHLRQLSNHTVTPDNPYISPRPFYELILNCNDVLKNFQIMRQTKKLTESDFNQRYSDIGCLRSFLYLQLGIHYGEVPYVTEALENVNDAANPSRFPRLPLKTLIDTLVNFTEALPFKEVYTTDVGGGTGTSLNITLDAYPTLKFFINKKVLLGDLYLWKGDYRTAARYYRDVMETATQGSAGENYYSQYKLGWSGNANLYISYTRAGDATSLNYSDGWGTMFSASDERFNREMIWALPYDSKFQPENPLIKLFSPIGGDYLVKPSQEIIDNWNDQRQNPVANAGSGSGIPYDARGLLSVRTIGGQPVVTKFISNYIPLNSSLPVNPLVKNGRWFLLRQAHLHLRFAEAANRDGFPRLAYALMNNGIPSVYDVSSITDKTNIMNTFMYPDPYKFDARNGVIPHYRSPWYRNIGIRARANVVNYPLTAASVPDSISQIEVGLINEQALETAFEGTRWADLLRVAIRRDDPSFIATKVYNKLNKNPMTAGIASQARAKLLARDWFLPFKWN
ncbi:MAG TPA: RagB/SusD family protein [Flavisolibacter sp.]|nr:RagB/SusD family protein [Flavisolibacter sp.]